MLRTNVKISSILQFQKPKMRPIKSAKRFFQAKNFVETEGVPFYRIIHK